MVGVKSVSVFNQDQIRMLKTKQSVWFQFPRPWLPCLRLMRREELAISLQPLSELLVNFKIISVQYLLTIVANILNIFTR